MAGQGTTQRRLARHGADGHRTGPAPARGRLRCCCLRPDQGQGGALGGPWREDSQLSRGARGPRHRVRDRGHAAGRPRGARPRPGSPPAVPRLRSWWICSTISVEASQQVRERLAARITALLAAPVMWATPGWRPRTAHPAVSGPHDAFEAARPYLDILGSGRPMSARVSWPGWFNRSQPFPRRRDAIPCGSNGLLSGISREAFLSCLNNSVMGSPFTRYKAPAFVNLEFHPTFTATLLRKDFELGLPPRGRREYRSQSPRWSTRLFRPSSEPGTPHARTLLLRLNWLRPAWPSPPCE